jgi:hypothetical protein
MSAERDEGPERGLRYGMDTDPEFQRRWVEARHLTGAQVDAAWRHGFDARDRFADRPFHEVRAWLQESWRGMGEPAAWAEVEDIVRSGYERYRGAGFGPSTDPGTEALGRFGPRTEGGSVLGGGTLDERPQPGDTHGTPEASPS